jgi:hypothetical protein
MSRIVPSMGFFRSFGVCSMRSRVCRTAGGSLSSRRRIWLSLPSPRYTPPPIL